MVIGIIFSILMLSHGVWALKNGRVYVHYGFYRRDQNNLLFNIFVFLYIMIPSAAILMMLILMILG